MALCKDKDGNTVTVLSVYFQASDNGVGKCLFSSRSGRRTVPTQPGAYVPATIVCNQRLFGCAALLYNTAMQLATEDDVLMVSEKDIPLITEA